MSPTRWIPAAAVLLSLCVPAARAAELPRKAPDFTVNLQGGKKLALSQFKGHAVIMAFILTTCSHCQMTVGVLTKLQNEYGPRGLQVVASAIEEDAEKDLPLFIRNFHPSFPVGFNKGGEAGAFIQPTGKLPQMPLVAFVDQQGVIRAQTEGEEPFFNDLELNLRKQIESMLKSTAPRVPSSKKSTAPAKKTD